MSLLLVPRLSEDAFHSNNKRLSRPSVKLGLSLIPNFKPLYRQRFRLTSLVCGRFILFPTCIEVGIDQLYQALFPWHLLESNGMIRLRMLSSEMMIMTLARRALDML